MSARIKVMIVDDALMMRKSLRDIISVQPDMEVQAVAADPYIAVEKLKVAKPDVIILDVEMPRMDGLTFLRKLMAQHPMPVIVLSSLTAKGSEIAIRALTYGAADVLSKQDLDFNHDTGFDNLLESIRKASVTDAYKLAKQLINVPVRKKPVIAFEGSSKVVVLGASTGGTTAIHQLLSQLPAYCYGMVVVQHMPKLFTRYFADHLNSITSLSVKEAEDGDIVLPGKVLIAPGDKHLQLAKNGTRIIVRTIDAPAVNRHRPSVDVLFESAAEVLGSKGIGVLLTGMGSDGAKGLLKLKQSGALTIAQDESTSVIYGMPREAVRLGAVVRELPLLSIPAALLNHN